MPIQQRIIRRPIQSSNLCKNVFLLGTVQQSPGVLGQERNEILAVVDPTDSGEGIVKMLIRFENNELAGCPWLV